MPDTQRSTAALLALTPDNTSGETSNQDLRDMLVSLLGGYAAIYVDEGATPQAFTASTPAKLTGFAANGPDASGMTPDHADDELVAGVDGVYWVACSLAMLGSTIGWTGRARLRKNGAAIPGAQARGVDASGFISLSFEFPVQCVAGDSITVWLDSSNSHNVTLTNAILAAKRIG